MYDYKISRKKTKVVSVGDIQIGGNNPISVQSMTNTLTTDVKSTIEQVRQLEEVGADIVRISCPDKESTAALSEIIKQVKVPIVADIHFHYRRAIEAAKAGAKCLRINPGNIGSKDKVKEVVQAAKDYGCSIRIGVNSGSLEEELLLKYKSPTPEAMLESAQKHMMILEDADFFNFKISVKASNIFLARGAYKLLSESCDYPLHLGITESGSKDFGTVMSSIGLGALLLDGIGDTLRVSLSADPVEEIKVGFNILKSLNLRNKGVRIISCPSCARQGFNIIKSVEQIEQAVEHIQEPIVVSILGCVVNGIGEAQHSDIGIVGISDKENVIYIKGQKDHKVGNQELIPHVIKLIEDLSLQKRNIK